MPLRAWCRMGLPARQRAGRGNLRDRATGAVLDPAPRRVAAEAASPDATARRCGRRPRWRATARARSHSAKVFAPVLHGRSVPAGREGRERTGRQGQARPSPSRPATPAIRRLRVANGSPLNAASYTLPVNPVLRSWLSRSWCGRARCDCLPGGRRGRRPSRPLPRRATKPARCADHGGRSRLRPIWDPRRSSSPPWRASWRKLCPSRSSPPARLLA